MDIVIGAFRGKEGQIRTALNRLREPTNHSLVMSSLWTLRDKIQKGDELHFLVGMMLAVPEEFKEDLVKLLHEGQKALGHEPA